MYLQFGVSFFLFLQWIGINGSFRQIELNGLRYLTLSRIPVRTLNSRTILPLLSTPAAIYDMTHLSR